MWRETALKFTKAAVFKKPVDLITLQDIEHRLRISLPAELRGLLLESDGMDGEYGLGSIWDSDRLVSDNLSFRNNSDFVDLYMPFDCLLFFADAGNGDQFAFTIRNNQIQSSDIFVWNHENDSRTWVAPS
jgi:hypothetical protein